MKCNCKGNAKNVKDVCNSLCVSYSVSVNGCSSCPLKRSATPPHVADSDSTSSNPNVDSTLNTVTAVSPTTPTTTHLSPTTITTTESTSTTTTTTELPTTTTIKEATSIESTTEPDWGELCKELCKKGDFL